MTDTATNSEPALTLAKASGLYAAALAIFIVVFYLGVAVSWFPGILTVIVFFALGVALSRVVLRGLVEWHPVYNTLENVSASKVRMLLAWPFAYPVLFFQLLVSKHL
jgi:hypothetical protein